MIEWAYEANDEVTHTHINENYFKKFIKPEETKKGTTSKRPS